MDTNSENPKIPKIYFCEICDFKTCNRKDYDRHLSTVKHTRLTNPNDKNPKNPFFSCLCGKAYKHSSSLCNHKKKCNLKAKDNILDNDNDNTINNKEETTKFNDKDLIMLLINENKEFRNLLVEQCKESSDFKNMMMEVIKNGTYNNNNNTVNSHNKAFNLQFFLNETCKDAMNINEFIDSIQLQLSDLEKMEEIGFVEGISNIIIKNLNALDVTKRPLHCTDKKRETIYIKDQGVWEKDVENTKIRGLVKKVAGKNSRLLQVFKEKHPDYNQYHSKYSTQYNKLVIEAFGGKGDNDLEKEDKIIRNITKNILVEK